MLAMLALVAPYCLQSLSTWVRLSPFCVRCTLPSMRMFLPLPTLTLLRPALTAIRLSPLPALMALGYLVLIFYFRARGGYEAEVLVTSVPFGADEHLKPLVALHDRVEDPLLGGSLEQHEAHVHSRS